MKKPTIASVGYAPSNLPANSAEIPRFIAEELSKISAAISALALGHLEMTHVAPEKPREGDIRLADGTNWNPNATGRGVYVYHTGTWNKL